MNSRLAELFKIKQEADSEIKDIQESCEHTHYRLGYWSYRVGHLVPARICAACVVLLEICAYPSNDYDYVVANNGNFNGTPLEYQKGLNGHVNQDT